MTGKEWYDSLDKPEWTPEPATIGLIWQIIYPKDAFSILSERWAMSDVEGVNRWRIVGRSLKGTRSVVAVEHEYIGDNFIVPTNI